MDDPRISILNKVENIVVRARKFNEAEPPVQGLQFNYLPKVLRVEDNQFSGYKRLSLEDPGLEPVLPDHVNVSSSRLQIRGATLPGQTYLFNAFDIDTLVYQVGVVGLSQTSILIGHEI